MNLSIAFWVIFIVAILFGGYRNRTNLQGWAMGDLVYLVLLGLLGWATFGSMIHR